jgi:hypothetical protein
MNDHEERTNTMTTKYLLMTLLLALLPSLARAADADIQSQIAALAAVGEQISAAEATKTALQAQTSQLIETDGQLKGKERQLTADYAQLQSETQSHRAVLDQHNISKPDPTNKSAVDSYNAEAARLNGISASLNSRKESLQAQYASLTEQRKELSQAALEWTQKMKRVTAELEDLKAREKTLKGQLRRTCLAKPSQDGENIKACENVNFDGDIQRDALIERGGANTVITPNSGGSRRTQEQAIEEYKRSGAASPGPKSLKHRAPPPPPTP